MELIKQELKQHENWDEDEHDELRKMVIENHKEIMSILNPISATYESVGRIGKWTMALAVFISIMIGILLGIKNLFK